MVVIQENRQTGELIDRRLGVRVSIVVSVVFLLNSILRGIRTPGRWAATHFLFNYDQGFSKRALLGAVIAALDRPYLYHYQFFFWFSMIVFVADILLLVALVKRLSDSGDSGSKLNAWLFCSSLAVVFFANAIGYFDQISLMLALLSLRIRGYYARAVLVGSCFSVSLLIHEIGFLTFFPVIFLRFLADLHDRRDGWKLTTLLAITLGLSILVLSAGQAHLSDASAEAMYHNLQAKADYHLRADSFSVLTFTIRDNWQLMGQVWQREWARQYFIFSLIVTLPTALYFYFQSRLNLPKSRHSRVITAAMAGASFAPLSLHFLGWDFPRWDALAVTTSFLVFTIVKLNFRPEPAEMRQVTGRSPLFLPAALIAFNLGSSIELFDGYVVQSFPYEGHITDAIDMLSGRAPFPPRPQRCLPGEPDCR
jgi:hypothetical protein